jgi:hypothetical protein
MRAPQLLSWFRVRKALSSTNHSISRTFFLVRLLIRPDIVMRCSWWVTADRRRRPLLYKSDTESASSLGSTIGYCRNGDTLAGLILQETTIL